MRVVLVAVLFAGVVLTFLVGSSGATAGCSFDPVSGMNTCVFDFTGAEQTWVVPPGVTNIHVVAKGAAGGTAVSGGAVGGRGAVVSGDLAVTPGATLYAEVGGTPTTNSSCDSSEPCLGGFNGGGSGSTLDGDGPGGGGASDVRTISRTVPGLDSLNSRLLVAAGGGGGGDGVPVSAPVPCAPGGAGGDAGMAGTAGTSCGPITNIGGGEGGAGTSTSGGSGGSSPVTFGSIGPGGPGDLGKGGGSGDSYGGGGGGGGGLYGGGGGGPVSPWAPGTFGCPSSPGNTENCYGAGGGGGGGSNLVPVNGTSGLTTDPASITISYTASVADQLTSLQTQVTGVGPGASLAQKITLTQEYVAANGTTAACGTLAAFIHQVNAQNGKKLTPTQAESFISQAQNIETTLGC